MARAGSWLAELRRRVDPAGPRRQFYTIAVTYVLFTLVDGALRLIVLMQANQVGFSAFQVSLMFVLYELLGVFTNLGAGALGARFGLKNALLLGLGLEIVSMVLLIPFSSGERWAWLGSQSSQIAYIMFAQAFAGVAKDMVKLSGKSVTKLAAAAEAAPTGGAAAAPSRLFNLVVWLTGFKNEFKGLGFFLGTLLQSLWGFQPALICLVCLVALLLPAAAGWLDRDLGRAGGRGAVNLRSVFRKPVGFLLLCVARFFLFGSRDLWFDVVLPLFLKNVLVWNPLVVGAFLAGWTILYGVIQSASGPVALRPLKCQPPTTRHLSPWAGALVGWMGLIALVFTILSSVFFGPGGPFDAANLFPAELSAAVVAVLVIGLLVYAGVFAVNSAVHSYLAVDLADHDKVALDVGFYYMANAGGRLTGTLLGGVLYSFYVPGAPFTVVDADGNPVTLSADQDASARFISFTACLWASALWSLFATAVSLSIRRYAPPPGAGPKVSATDTGSPGPAEILELETVLEEAERVGGDTDNLLAPAADADGGSGAAPGRDRM